MDRKNWASPFAKQETPAESATAFWPTFDFPTSADDAKDSCLSDQIYAPAPQPMENPAQLELDLPHPPSNVGWSPLRWNMVIASTWTGCFHYPAIMRELKKATSWIMPYCVLACILPWLFFPPQVPHYQRIFGLATGVAALVCLALLSCLVPLVVLCFSKCRLSMQNEEKAMALYFLCSHSIAYGSAVLLRSFTTMQGFLFWLPATALTLVLSWMCVVQGSMARCLAHRKLQHPGLGWGFAIVLDFILFHLLTLSTIILSGGY